MSETTMYRVPTAGPIEAVETFHNAWGAAMRVWQSLAEAHFSGRFVPTMDPAELSAFWALARNPKLSPFDRLAMAFTFDRVICERDKAPLLAQALRAFDAAYPVPANYQNHLPAIADALDRHAADPDTIGFCFQQTSVAADAWQMEDVCPDPFHVDALDADGEPRCPTCGNAPEEETFSRPFDWHADHWRGEHKFLFETYAQDPQPQPETKP